MNTIQFHFCHTVQNRYTDAKLVSRGTNRTSLFQQINETFLHYFLTNKITSEIKTLEGKNIYCLYQSESTYKSL